MGWGGGGGVKLETQNRMLLQATTVSKVRPYSGTKMAVVHMQTFFKLHQVFLAFMDIRCDKVQRMSAKEAIKCPEPSMSTNN